MLEEAGCEPVDCGIARDDEQVLTATITRAVDECDALVTSGAVSMGDYDFVKVVLERLAADAPGGTYALDADRDQAGEAARVRGDRRRAGVRSARQPGLVAGELRAARPARAAAARGPVRRAAPSPCVAVAASPLRRRPDGRVHFDRVGVRYEDGGYVCERAGVQASNVLSGMAAATGLAVLEDGAGVEAGDRVPVLLLGGA